MRQRLDRKHNISNGKEAIGTFLCACCEGRGVRSAKDSRSQSEIKACLFWRASCRQ